MHPLKFLEVTDLSWGHYQPTGLRSSSCIAAVAFFKANMDRVSGLIALSPYTVWVTTEWTLASGRAQEEVLGKGAVPDEGDPRRQLIAKKSMAYLAQSINSKMDSRQLVMIQMARVFEANVAHSRPDIHEATESLLKSIIIQTWTAVETLAQDLWERAINEHPHELSQVKFPENDRKNLSVESLQKLGFDLSKKMGTLLKGKFKFQTLGGIRFAYSEAFSNGGGAVMASLQDKNMDALNLLRNVLVHSGGIINEDFMERSKPIELLSPVRTYGKGHQIRFDGEMVRGYATEVLKRCSDLLVVVDDWLHKY